MGRLKRFLLIFVLAFFAAGAYFFYTVQIFEQPKIFFNSAQPSSLTPQNQYCFAVNSPLQFIRQNRFKFVVWNIHKGLDKGWQQSLQQFAQEADFLLLQEVASTQQLAQEIPQFSTALYVTSFSYLGRKSGVSILAKTMPQRICGGAEKEPWILIPKVGNAMTFPLQNGQSLLVVNLHLVNFEFHPTSYRNQLENMMRLIAQHQGPIILAGDFNSWNQPRLNLVRRFAKQYQLNEVNYHPDERLRFLTNPLDHVFVRGLNVITSTTVKTSSSDHNPIFVEVALDKPNSK